MVLDCPSEDDDVSSSAATDGVDERRGSTNTNTITITVTTLVAVSVATVAMIILMI